MFILAYLLIVLIRANHVVVPHIVSGVVGAVAIVEGVFYVICLLIAVFGFIEIGRGK